MAVMVVGTCCLEADELIFQNGVGGYASAQDVTLQGEPEENAKFNYGDDDKLSVSGVPWGGSKELGLIRFDQITGASSHQIPPGAIIVSARLELHKIEDKPKNEDQYEQEGKDAMISAFSMLRHFDAGRSLGAAEEKAACFSYRAFSGEFPTYWGDKNQIENGPVADVDYDSWKPANSPLRPGESDIWMTWDVTNIVDIWVQHPELNHGLYLKTYGYWIGAQFDSSDAGDQQHRPRLIVEFEPASAPRK